MQQTSSGLPDNIVDRGQRDELAALIRRFLNEEIGAFDFDEQLDAFRDSEDSAVNHVAFALWFHYDDLEDHFVTLSKPGWGYFQRLLLLLESSGSVQTTTSRHWSFTQVVAFAALLAYAGVVCTLGWNSLNALVLFAGLPFGLISIGITRFQSTTSSNPNELILLPFATILDLQTAYESVSFKKARYPRHLQSRRIRSRMEAAVMFLPFFAAWLFLSPLVLICQTMPMTESRPRVIMM